MTLSKFLVAMDYNTTTQNGTARIYAMIAVRMYVLYVKEAAKVSV
jgi:hypothetical protein